MDSIETTMEINYKKNIIMILLILKFVCVRNSDVIVSVNTIVISIFISHAFVVLNVYNNLLEYKKGSQGKRALLVIFSFFFTLTTLHRS